VLAQRISIIGPPGSGKSTLAGLLSQQTGIPAISLDAHYFEPGWIVKSPEERNRITVELASQPAWIMEGLWGSTMHLRLPVSDMIIFLDFPTHICFPRVIKRLLTHYGRVREDAAPGCPERWDWEFIKFVWNNNERRERVWTQVKHHAGQTQLIVLKNPLQVKLFLQSAC
jgi:adenylate kinase family enzyme